MARQDAFRNSRFGQELEQVQTRKDEPSDLHLAWLPTAEPKPTPKRNREWERKHPTTFFRKVPRDIRDRVTQIARETGYTASQVAQAFLEFALMCYRRGDFVLDIGLGKQGMTLFPDGWGTKKPLWAERTWGEQRPPKKMRRRRKNDQLWKSFVAYRLSPDLVENLRQVGEGLARGEVVARFLTHAIEAYNQGQLVLMEPGDD